MLLTSLNFVGILVILISPLPNARACHVSEAPGHCRKTGGQERICSGVSRELYKAKALYQFHGTLFLFLPPSMTTFLHPTFPCPLRHTQPKHHHYLLFPKSTIRITLAAPLLLPVTAHPKLIFKYLDCVLALIVAFLPSQTYDINHALQFFNSFTFPYYSP